MSSIAGLLAPVDRRQEGATFVELAGPNDAVAGIIRALIAPGMLTPIPYTRCSHLSPDSPVPLRGPALLAFDGERDRIIDAGAVATARLRVDGPIVIDPERAIALAAERGVFHSPATRGL